MKLFFTQIKIFCIVVINYRKMCKKKNILFFFYIFPPLGFVLYKFFLKLFLSKNYLNYINFILGYRIFRCCIRFLNAEERYFLQNNLKY